jgi:hypothetical protein
VSSLDVAKWQVRQAIRDLKQNKQQNAMNNDQFSEICAERRLTITHTELLAHTIATCTTTTCDFNVEQCETLTAELEELCESSICVAVEGNSDEQHRKCLDICLGIVS